MKKEGIRYAALDIIFSMVIYYLFTFKLTDWALNNAFLASRFSFSVLCLVPQVAAITVLILYIKLLAGAELKDYYLSVFPKFRWILAGILSAALYAVIVLLILPGEWTVRIGEPAVLSVLAAGWRSVRAYLLYAHYFIPLIFGIFFAALRRRTSLPAALFGVWVVVTLTDYDRIDSITDIAGMINSGILAAAVGLIAEYTGSVWSGVFYDAAHEILFDQYLIHIMPGFLHPHPDHDNILLMHVARNRDWIPNVLVIGHEVDDSVTMAIINLLLIAYLYAKIRKREANPVIENNSGDSSRE